MHAAPSKVDVYSAIADPTRRAMLLRLAHEGRKNVSQLMKPFSISQPAVSKHLRILREAGLVRSRRSGRMRLYEIQAERLRQVDDWIAHFSKYWDARLDSLGEYLNKKTPARSRAARDRSE